MTTVHRVPSDPGLFPSMRSRRKPFALPRLHQRRRRQPAEYFRYGLGRGQDGTVESGLARCPHQKPRTPGEETACGSSAWRFAGWIPSLPSPIRRSSRSLTFVGMIGIIDPPRPEAAAAVDKCKTAGIRPVMITGDHPLTAQYIASQVGIADGGTGSHRAGTGSPLRSRTGAPGRVGGGLCAGFARAQAEDRGGSSAARRTSWR